MKPLLFYSLLLCATVLTVSKGQNLPNNLKPEQENQSKANLTFSNLENEDEFTSEDLNKNASIDSLDNLPGSPMSQEHEANDSDSLEKVLRLMQRRKREILDDENYQRFARYRYPLTKKQYISELSSEQENAGFGQNEPDVDERENGINDYEDYETYAPYSFKERVQSSPNRISPEDIRVLLEGIKDVKQFKKRRNSKFLPSFGSGTDPGQYYDVKRKRYEGLHQSVPETRNVGHGNNIPDVSNQLYDGVYGDIIKKILRRNDKGQIEYNPYLKRMKRENTEKKSTENKKNSTKEEESDSSKSNEVQISANDIRLKREYNPALDLYQRENNFEQMKNNLLAQKYFKSLSRDLGDKRKKNVPVMQPMMIHRQIQNPEVIFMFQTELKEAKEKLIEEAKEVMGQIIRQQNAKLSKQDEEAVRVILQNLQDIEVLNDTLSKILYLYEKETVRKRAMDLVEDKDQEKKKTGEAFQLRSEGKKKPEKKYGRNEVKKGRKNHFDEDTKTKRNDAFQSFFGLNQREDCPVLERILTNCAVVSKIVGDGNLAFVEPCLRHEICYMCGSGLDVFEHECESILSSSLESECLEDSSNEPNLECLNAAEKAFGVLIDPSRYDDRGSCTFDPCVRELLDSH